ncbi:hypothetical protein [Marininema halotolerans]|nr:hypothetical protein [Marininema halotolerans]
MKSLKKINPVLLIIILTMAWGSTSFSHAIDNEGNQPIVQPLSDTEPRHG